MNDDLRVVDPPGTDAPVAVPTGAFADSPTGLIDAIDGPGAAAAPPVRRGRRWLGRLGLLLVVLIAAVAVGFQVQTAHVREEVRQAETDQRLAELEEDTARVRLESVGDRVIVAQDNKADAQAVLDGSRQAMAAQGLEEATLHDAQVKKAGEVKDLRTQGKTVRAAIADQKRLQPAAGDCVFDLLRGLSDRSAKNTPACATVASLAGPG